MNLLFFVIIACGLTASITTDDICHRTDFYVSQRSLSCASERRDCGCANLKREKATEWGSLEEETTGKNIDKSEEDDLVGKEEIIRTARTNQMAFIESGVFTMGTDKPYLPRTEKPLEEKSSWMLFTRMFMKLATLSLRYLLIAQDT